jgi:iron(III) transport system substrate-binding protein
MSDRNKSRSGLGACVSLLFACFLASGCRSAAPHVVLYCAQDREFAEPILDEFTRRTGYEVVVRYDSEANKSVSLCEDLLREAKRPRCDVHWNNEIIGTIRLERECILDSYDCPAARDYPIHCRGPDHRWHAFAARARVILVNTDLVARSERPTAWQDLTERRWSKRFVMAKPQFGTTATQAACLFQAWGDAKARTYYQRLRDNGMHLVPGNRQVAEGVGRGDYAVGFTDTDDAMAEVDAGKPVALIFPNGADPRDGTLFIPNTVAVIRGGPNPDIARRLADYLLSPEVEEKLALGKSRQIPLNPKVKVSLPAAIAPALNVRPMPVDFAKAADSWRDIQRFMSREIARP